MRHHVIGILGALVATATVGRAQAATCNRGPGAAIGIKSYTCTSCGAEQKTGGSTTYFFATEPVVIAGTPESPFRAGDVIVAVNGRPITTREGAHEFAYPKPGKVEVRYRREDGAQRYDVTLALTVTADCELAPGQSVRTNYDKGSDKPRWAYAALDSNGLPITGPPPPQDPTLRLGFAVSCTPSCTRVNRLGTTFWKHDGYPAVVAVRAGSPAAEAGLRLGDLIAEVDGLSVTDERGSLALQRSQSAPPPPLIVVDGTVLTEPAREIALIIIRDGARLSKVLRIGR